VEEYENKPKDFESKKGDSMPSAAMIANGLYDDNLYKEPKLDKGTAGESSLMGILSSKASKLMEALKGKKGKEEPEHISEQQKFFGQLETEYIRKRNKDKV
jgi:hypothetical protein